MKIALIGYGAMGKLIHRIAEEKGHEIAVIIDDADAGLSVDELAAKLRLSLIHISEPTRPY